MIAPAPWPAALVGTPGVAVIEQQRGLAPSRCNVPCPYAPNLSADCNNFLSNFPRPPQQQPELYKLTLFCRAAAAAAALVNKQNGL
jgi:hypothetical protein